MDKVFSKMLCTTCGYANLSSHIRTPHRLLECLLGSSRWFQIRTLSTILPNWTVLPFPECMFWNGKKSPTPSQTKSHSMINTNHSSHIHTKILLALREWAVKQYTICTLLQFIHEMQSILHDTYQCCVIVDSKQQAGITTWKADDCNRYVS